MELLSFTYLFIDILLIAAAISGIFVSWILSLVSVVLLLFYPFIYEPLLALFFRFRFKLKISEKIQQRNKEQFAKTNSILYRSRQVLDKLIRSDPERGFAYVFNQNEPDYAEIYHFYSVKQLILLNYSAYLSYVFLKPLFFIPGSILRLIFLRKFLHQTQGTLNGCSLAIEKKMAVNLSGGLHHAETYASAGICPYNDIGLGIQHVWHFHAQIKTIMIIDLDAHQGNGHARDKQTFTTALNDPKNDNPILIKKRIFILDCFNSDLGFPKDEVALTYVDIPIGLKCNETDEGYLKSIGQGLEQSKFRCKPDLIIYNAGSDVLKGNLAGKMKISAEAIIKRDQLVFDFAQSSDTPILMLLSGGLEKENADVIADSILNLAKRHEELNYSKKRSN